MAGLISDEILEEVRSKANIVEIIGQSVQLKKAGNGSWKGCCPFHQEKTPSFVVNEGRQRYHCFGCGKGGDVFRFVMERENLEFPEAIRSLASRCGVNIPEEDNSKSTPAQRQAAKAKSDKRSRILEIMEDYARFFQYNLRENQNPAVSSYLQGRNLDGETIEKFRIGAAVDSWDACLKLGEQRGYSENELLEAGIILKNENSGKIYDRFRNRLVFTITNERGQVVGFSARTIEKESQGAKYVNSPETLVFKKSAILYAFSHARAAIGEFKQVILCEGQLDVIAMHRGGYPCSVAPQGTAFTEEQASLLRRYTDKILLAFDSDSAGQKAILRSLEMLFNLDFEVRVLEMPAGDDPDGIFRANGAAGIKSMVDNNIDILEFLIKSLRQSFDMNSPFDRSRFLTAILEYLSRLKNRVVLENYLQKLSELLQLKLELIQAELGKIMQRNLNQQNYAERRHPQPPPQEVEKVVAVRREALHAEVSLLEIALSNENHARRIGDEISPEMLGNSGVSKALNLVIGLALNHEYDQVIPELNRFDREQGDSNLSRILTEGNEFLSQNIDKALEDCIQELKRRQADAKKSEIMEKMKIATTPEERMALLQEFSKL